MRYRLTVLVLALAAVLAACGAAQPMSADPAAPPALPSSAIDVTKQDMPYGFPATLTWCAHGFRYVMAYAITDSGGPQNTSTALVSNPDPTCVR